MHFSSNTNRHLDRSTERVYNIEVDGDHAYRVGKGVGYNNGHF
ncbi:hypothetical protein [uncultured Gimesia sp.]|nr:hypothetical protein [uncultured Gimesia sp.]